MFPEDRVLVGVINTRRDLRFMREDRWYRIPQERMPDGVFIDYLAFFLSRTAASDFDASGVHYYARVRGVELAYRHQLIPNSQDHPRADATYYKVQLGDAIARVPPITNPTRRTVAFIYTTWDRFVAAQHITDLYSTADYFVDRIFHAL